MSKAEELASKEWSDLGFCNNEQSNAFKLGYLKGYHQAEKDFELCWEDIKEIYFLFRAVLNEWYGHEFSDEGICQEVLKRFKEMKHVK